MKLKKFIKKFNLNSKGIKIRHFENDDYETRTLENVYYAHKELLEKQVHHLDVMGSDLFIYLEP